MKKIFFIVLSALLLLGITQAWAEMSPSAVSGTSYLDNQVYTIMYNNSGTNIAKNAVVILDTTGTAGSTLGSYITTTTSAGSQYVIGVTDEAIATASTGRICRRGPHLVNTATGETTGATLTTSTTAGKADTGTSTSNQYGYLGVNLGNSDTNVYWVWVNPSVQ